MNSGIPDLAERYEEMMDGFGEEGLEDCQDDARPTLPRRRNAAGAESDT